MKICDSSMFYRSPVKLTMPAEQSTPEGTLSLDELRQRARRPS
jgi:hypothetical protein